MLLPYVIGALISLGQASPPAEIKLPVDRPPVRASLGAPLEVEVISAQKPEPLPKPKEATETPTPKPPEEKPKKVNVSGNGSWTDDGTGNGSVIFGPIYPEGPQGKGFVHSLLRAYVTEFRKPDDNGDGNGEDAPPQRRAMPEPWSAPPFPGHEYQGYPLIGVPKSTDVYPLMKAVYESTEGTRMGDWIKDSGIKLYGWVTVSGNFSTATNSNSPTSYWIVPNSFQMDQFVMRFEREMDTVQTDHCDWGFRSTHMYGEDYRYTTAGGWLSRQLQVHNPLYGYDPIEQYFDFYIPYVLEGMAIRVGRWVACPDIETQLAPDNYLASHSILFTYDTYTQTGLMFTFRPHEQWLFQLGINCGDDMAPWYQGATVSGFAAVRWVSKDNNDALYVALNQFNNAEFRHFELDGQPAGHDNYNYIVGTWEHRFNALFHTKTEAYYMWEHDAELGGTPSIGPSQSFAPAGTDNALIPGWSHAYGILNYTMMALSKNDYLTVRNEWWRDDTGFRSGFAGNYTSHTIGWSHNFNAVMQIRPEIGYYRNWDQPAFDLGTKRGMLMGGFDFTFRW